MIPESTATPRLSQGVSARLLSVLAMQIRSFKGQSAAETTPQKCLDSGNPRMLACPVVLVRPIEIIHSWGFDRPQED